MKILGRLGVAPEGKNVSLKQNEMKRNEMKRNRTKKHVNQNFDYWNISQT